LRLRWVDGSQLPATALGREKENNVRTSLAAVGTVAVLALRPASGALAQSNGATQTAQAETNDDDGGKIGLLGLLGLAGFAGLARRDRDRGIERR